MPAADPLQRRVALLVAGCFFMENLDGTIVTTAAPRIGRALHVPATSLGLVIGLERSDPARPHRAHRAARRVGPLGRSHLLFDDRLQRHAAGSDPRRGDDA
jgi:hypothetical protein